MVRVKHGVPPFYLIRPIRPADVVVDAGPKPLAPAVVSAGLEVPSFPYSAGTRDCRLPRPPKCGSRSFYFPRIIRSRSALYSQPISAITASTYIHTSIAMTAPILPYITL